MTNESSGPGRARLPWLLWLLCGSALGLGLWLTWQKWSGRITSIKGCGGFGDCSQVLGSEWSQWMLIPVSLLAALLYGAVIFLTLPAMQRVLGPRGKSLLVGAAALILMAAAWFGGLLVWKQTFCPWCLAMHSLGIAAAAVILRGAWLHRGEHRGGFGAALLGSIAAMLVLIGGQLWGPRPDTHLITQGGLLSAPVSTPPAPAAGPRNIAFFGQELVYDARALPILGSPDAPQVLVEYFDYTCSSCRTMYGDLKELKTRRPGEFAIIVLPVPLHRACNPAMKQGMPDHENACALATLALAAWQAAPAKFEELHDFLMTTKPSLPDALAKARLLCGEAALTAAQADPAVDQRLKENLTVFARLTQKSIAMPKLMLRDQQVMHGVARNTAEFLRAIDQVFPRK